MDATMYDIRPDQGAVIDPDCGTVETTLYTTESVAPPDGDVQDEVDSVARREAFFSEVGRAFIAAGRKKVDDASFNWLMLNGIPSSPRELWQVIDGVWFAAIAWAGSDGYVAITDKGRRGPDEKPIQTDASEYLKELAEVLKDQEAQPDLGKKGFKYL